MARRRAEREERIIEEMREKIDDMCGLSAMFADGVWSNMTSQAYCVACPAPGDTIEMMFDADTRCADCGCRLGDMS